ncbi:MAG: hypothetical protein J1G38_04340 [Clostridiales bacterium]|nr:hypothetical protein [Clostridiales bacterium]
MKRKSLSIAFAAVGVAAYAFTLFACGDDKSDGGNAKPLPDYEITVPDETTIKSQTVTEAQWQAAWKLDAVSNVTFVGNGYTVDDGETVDYSTSIVKVNGSKRYEKLPVMHSLFSGLTAYDEKYYSATKDGVVMYEKYTDIWDGQVTDEIINFNVACDLNCPDVKDSFLQFVYDAENAQYTYTDSGNAQYTYAYTVKIFGGKLRYVKIETEFTTGERVGTKHVYENNIYDYGSTAVTLPKLPTGGGSAIGGGSSDIERTVTEDEWKSLLSAERIGSCVITETVGDDRTRLLIDADNDRFSIEAADGSVQTYAKLDGRCYLFTRDGSEWSVAAITEAQYSERFNGCFAWAAILSGLYAEFEYVGEEHNWWGYYFASGMSFGGATADVRLDFSGLANDDGVNKKWDYLLITGKRSSAYPDNGTAFTVALRCNARKPNITVPDITLPE